MREGPPLKGCLAGACNTLEALCKAWVMQSSPSPSLHLLCAGGQVQHVEVAQSGFACMQLLITTHLHHHCDVLDLQLTLSAGRKEQGLEMYEWLDSSVLLLQLPATITSGCLLRDP